MPDAEPSRLVRALSSSRVLDGMKGLMGGLWVGGTVSLTRDAVVFEPNWVNRLAHVRVASRALPLSHVVQVKDRSGWFTRIVDVRTDDNQTLTFRCYGAPAFARKIRGAVDGCRPG
ncbi:MAG TPA: hypothetical protein VGF29_14825 [Hyphomicrobiaceae bacterium]